jgi:hypothetical protein
MVIYNNEQEAKKAVEKIGKDETGKLLTFYIKHPTENRYVVWDKDLILPEDWKVKPQR